MTAYNVAKASDLQDGKMIAVDVPGVEGAQVLLSQVAGKIYATGAKCTHYGAPLANGALSHSGCVTCPWHGACFNVRDGDIEDGPGLDRLISYPVSVRDGDVIVEADADELKTGRSEPHLAQCSKSDDAHIVIVGGGGSGSLCAEVARQSGFGGRITVLSAEPYLPIDRPKLSKALIADPAKLQLRSAEYYRKLNIDFCAGARVVDVDTDARTVGLADGTTVAYTKLVLATGGVPRKLPLPGFDASNVFVLRSVTDVQAIVAARDRDNGRAKNIVIIGSSFIGMELALAVKDHNVHVVGMEAAPLANVLGEQVGRGIQKIHEANGTVFHLQAQVDSARVQDGAATSVLLKDGTELPCDFVVVGAGVKPATEFLPSSIPRQADGGIEVDGHLRVKGLDSVYAIGDIARFPLDFTGASQRVEHWDVALNHGRTLGKHLAGVDVAPTSTQIPVFWSAQGAQMRYVGSASGKDNVHVDGDPAATKFIAYYAGADGKVKAVASMGKDPMPMRALTLWKEGGSFTVDDVKSGRITL